MKSCKIIKAVKELRSYIKESKDKTLGFVPTMGALHEGHISLIKEARANNDIVVVSIFVNPTQFLKGEDLDKYPKREEADKKICELAGVDYLFMPDITQMYGKDEVLIKAPSAKGFILEGYRRPGHFDGVLQIVLKLFNIVNPTDAYFGKKDAQQLFLIKQMVKDFYLDINIVECDIVRESNGLAMSSRNVYLSQKERSKALCISKALKRAAKSVGSNIIECDALYRQMYELMHKKDGFEDVGFELEYIAFVDRDFNKIDKIEVSNSIILVAAKVGSTRLIDNIWV